MAWMAGAAALIPSLFGTDKNGASSGTSTTESEAEAKRLDLSVSGKLSSTSGTTDTKATTTADKTGTSSTDSLVNSIINSASLATTNQYGTSAQDTVGTTASSGAQSTQGTTLGGTQTTATETGTQKGTTTQDSSTATSNVTDTLSKVFQDTISNIVKNTNTSGVQTSSGSVNTSKLNISQEGVQSMINSILGGSQGLASLTSQEKVAGVYNSSITDQLVNDLIARTVGAVAEKTGETVQKIGGSTITNQQTTGETSAATESTRGTTDTSARSVGTSDTTAKTVSDLATTRQADTLAKTVQVANTAQQNVANTATSQQQRGSSTSSQQTGTTSTQDTAQTAKQDTTSAEKTSTVADTLQNINTSSSDLAATVLDSTLNTKGTQKTATDTRQSEESGGLLSWVICTELHKQGLMQTRYYIPGARAFSHLPPIVQRGYHVWAVPLVLRMRRSPLLSQLLAVPFGWRAENIAAHAGVKGARKMWKGAAVTALLYIPCFLIGLVVREQDSQVNSLYHKQRNQVRGI